jgi:hypothetical protein
LWQQGDEAIVSTFSPEREHPRPAKDLLRGYFEDDIFRAK